MMKTLGTLFLTFCLPLPLFAHEGHHLMQMDWIRWLGSFHPILNHFPIALTVMTGFSELLFYWTGKPIYEQSSRFMILAAAITIVPTALLGLALGSVAGYSGWEAEYYGWHRLFGIITSFIVIGTSYTREYHGRENTYFLLLVLSIVLIIITGYFGGSLTFGPSTLMPPL